MSHDTGDRPERDTRRDAWLKAQGIAVMRIPARDLMRRIDEAADAIVRLAAARMEAEAPSTVLRTVPLRFAWEDNGGGR